MHIRIQPAVLENLADISVLTSELGYEAGPAESMEWLRYLLDSRNHLVLVALTENGTVCGWLVMEKRISLETGFKAEITGLVVAQRYRRQGAGQKLVLEGIQWAKYSGLGKIVVRSNTTRTASHLFYQKMGFSMTKSAHHYERLSFD